MGGCEIDTTFGSVDEGVQNVSGLLTDLGVGLLPYSNMTWSTETPGNDDDVNGGARSKGVEEAGFGDATHDESHNFSEIVGTPLAMAYLINNAILSSPDSTSGPELPVACAVVERYDPGTSSGRSFCGVVDELMMNGSNVPGNDHGFGVRGKQPERNGEKEESCDGGYMSSGSDRLNRSYGSDGSTIKSNGILEEFAISDEGLHRSGVDVNDDPLVDPARHFESPDGQSGCHRMPSALAKEELISMLSYASGGILDSDASSHDATIKDDALPLEEYLNGESQSMTRTPPPSPLGIELPAEMTSRGVWDVPLANGRPRYDAPLPPTLIQPPPTPAEYLFSSGSRFTNATGVLSSDNFKRIKEIEKMIEDNRNKIRIMKETISTEITKSRRGNAPGSIDQTDSRNFRGSAGHLMHPKQAKHVSFSSQNTEWSNASGLSSGDLRSWQGTNSINRSYGDFGDGDADMAERVVESFNPDVRYSSLGTDFPRGESTTLVEMIPMATDGVFISEVEICSCSDDGDKEATHPDDSTFKIKDSLLWRNVDDDDIIVSSTSSKAPATESNAEHYTFTETVVEETVHTRIHPGEMIRPTISPSVSLAPPSLFIPPTFFLSEDAATWDELTTNMPPETSETESVLKNDGEAERAKERPLATTAEKENDPNEHSTESDVKTESSGCSAKTVCRGVGLTLLSVAVSVILFVAFLVVAFELDHDVPYVTDQEAVIELKRSVYGPARDFVVKLFKQ